MTAATQFDLVALLERVGARPPRYGRGKWGCPKHSGSPSVSVDLDRGLFNCHHAGCDFHGNSFTLARGLGLARRLSPAEARALRLERERAEAAASAFLVRVRGARFGLMALHVELLNLLDQAHERLKANCEDDAGWEALAHVYSELPRVRAELILVSEGTIEDRLAWLDADKETRHEMVNCILQVGGVPTCDGRFLELDDARVPRTSANGSKA